MRFDLDWKNWDLDYKSYPHVSRRFILNQLWLGPLYIEWESGHKF